MAARTAKTVEEFDPTADPTESPEGWEWDTVEEGAASKVIFDTIGDQFVGQLIGKEHVTLEPMADGSDPSFDLWMFRGRDGEKYAVNASYALDEAMKDVEQGKWVRLTYVKDVKTARNLNPMKSFKVDVRK